MYSTITELYTSTEMIPVDDPNILWIVILSFIIAFFLAFGIGANDVANSFGTSVGSKVLTIRQACILATIFEITGACLLGYKVSSTIRTGMIDVEQYDGQSKLLMLGYMSALFGSAIWNLFATLFGLPVSGTHSIVGSIIGFSVVGKGFSSVKWAGLTKIVVSWFLSPVLSGTVSMSLYLFIRWYIINQEDPLKNGLKMLPLFYGFTIFINIFSIVHNGPNVLKYVTWWIALLVACVVGLVVGLLVRIWIVPKLREKILEIKNNLIHKGINSTHIDLVKPTSLPLTITSDGKDITKHYSAVSSDPVSIISVQTLPGEFLPSSTPTTPQKDIESNDNDDIQKIKEQLKLQQQQQIDPDDDKPEVAKIFTFLHILTACFSSFTHGANDTSNAIGPLVAVVMLYRTGGQNLETPWYLLLFGGVGMSVGLWIWGRRVIQTMGKDLTKVTPSTGFTAEIGAATTVLIASKIGLPVSTTHCQVGSVVFVGKAMKSKEGVNWKLFMNIALSWALTVPLSALFSAFAMYLLKFTL